MPETTMTTQLDELPEGEAPDDERWYTTAEAAEYLGVSRFVVGRLARCGDLPSYRSPFDKRARFFDIDDLDNIDMTPVSAG